MYDKNNIIDLDLSNELFDIDSSEDNYIPNMMIDNNDLKKKSKIIKNQEDRDNLIDTKYDFDKVWDTYCDKYEKNPDILPKADRIIVIGDIHGDFKILRESLKLANVIDSNDEWIGKNTIVVQVGDQIDRCRYNKNTKIICNKPGATIDDEGNDWNILNYMTALHNKAKITGGAVYSLIGNHEIMNVNGDFRYVSHEGINEMKVKDYVDNKSFIDYYKIRNKIPKDLKDEDLKKYVLERLTNEDVRRWVYSPGNPASNFLACTRKVAIIIGSNLFVHGGILPHIAYKYNIKSINKLMTLFLLKKIKSSEYKDLFLDYTNSPLWTRAFARLDNIDEKDCNRLLKPLEQVYEVYKVGKIYVGHTPMMKTGITSICNDKIWLTDYGASTAFNPFDETITETGDKISNIRSINRKVQVLEILNDNEINILK